MAGIAIPENLRPTIAAIAKYHFWILAALVPLILLPLLLVGTSALRGRIKARQGQIDAKFSQAQSVTSKQPHPNEGWRTAIDTDVEAVNRETLDEWRRFWHSQRSLRTWPGELGQPFLDDVADLAPGGELDRTSLVRYQNMVPRLVRSLPARMGVEDAMTGTTADGVRPDVLPGVTNAARLEPPLSWNATDQRRLYDSFVWKRAPITAQVLLAQEELWVYGLFCDLIGGFVKSAGATGAHDSPLTFVEELAVGFPANVSIGQANRQERRIFVPPQGANPAESAAMMPTDALPGGEGSSQAPWHPRFSAGGGGPRPDIPGAGAAPAGPKPDDYRGWIYVDFAGKPLSASELAADDRKAMRMVHLMPFLLRVVVDQRHLDRLLAMLAASPVPIDVRQVRINPGVGIPEDAGAGPAAPAFGGREGQPGQPASRRSNDVLVELRGSVALATPPVEPQAAAEAAP